MCKSLSGAAVDSTATRKLAKAIRSTVLKMVHRARASHVGSALSIADILAVLYGSVMRLDARDPGSPDRDRFILSKGHACVAVYAALAEIGSFDRALLDSYGTDFSPFMSHISHKVAGVEFSTGSLGHGLPFGVGKALAAKSQGATWRTFVLLSDGEMDAGSNWEALLFAAHHGLAGLTAIIDYNKLQSLDTVQRTIGLEPLVEKLLAFGWHVVEVDGHDHSQILTALKTIDASRPSMILAHTVKGRGVGFMENRVEWHYKSPNDEQLTLALAEIEAADA
jgi:transketolase